ncbi:unnamed protein product, partial [Sphacelaria rigidula]
MADMGKLRAALGKVPGAEADLPQLPHSYRRSFDLGHLTRRRRRLQRFLQVVLNNPALRDSDVFREFLSPECRKSMDYMKNAVMTGTRRIARSVPMSMPNSKSIQKHIPIPKGVPKFPTKYNPYRRTSKRNSNVDNPSSLDDETYQSSFPGSSPDSFHGSGGVTLGDHAGAALGSEPAAAVAAAAPGTPDSSMSLGAVDESGHFVDPPLVTSTSSPRRKSYLWKRNAKPNNNGAQAQPTAPAAMSVAAGAVDIGSSRGGGGGGGGAGAGGHGGRESGDAGEIGVLGTVDEAAATMDAPSPLSSSSAADINPAAVVEDRKGKWEEDANGVRRWVPGVGVKAGMTGPTVGYIVQGCEDGRFGHTFEVRGPSFATDKSKVQAGPALCSLVYADIITGKPSKSATADTAVATAAAAGDREASSAEAGRVDHIAVKGPCRETIAKLTSRQGSQEAAAVGSGVGRGERSPFLFIVNFQV